MGNFMAIPLETVINYLLDCGSDSNSADLYDIAMEDQILVIFVICFPGFSITITKIGYLSENIICLNPLID